MTTDHFLQMFPAACAGFGLFLAGGANLVLRNRGRAPRIAATGAGAAVGVTCAAALDQPGAVTGTVRLVALGLVPFALLASNRLVGAASALVACLHRSIVRSALLGVGGIGLTLGSIVVFERADKTEQDAAMAELDWMARVPMTASDRAKATTDRGNPIVLNEPIGTREGVDWYGAEQRTLKGARLDGQVICRGGGTEQSNCHGWVFTGGRFNLSAETVELILKENGYTGTHEPQPGDLAIYRTNGGIAHTAVVRYVTEGLPVLVEGKWGALGVFLHPVDKSTYGSEYTFYRSARAGHLLAGLGGSDPAAQAPMATE